MSYTGQDGAFPRTSRMLRSPVLRRQGYALVALALLFAAWGVWLRLGSVTIYAVSTQARLEARAQPMAVQASVDGQVVAVDLHLGRIVQAGEVLVRLDARALELELETLQIAIASGAASLEALREQLRAEERARDAVSQLASQSTNAAKARVAQEQKSLELKERESGVVNRLRDAAAASGLEALHANATVESQRAQLTTTAAQAALDTRSGAMTLRDREARLAGVRYALAQADADGKKLVAQRRALDWAIERRTIRAPAAGTVVDVLPLSPGTTLTSQTRVATILPFGDVRVVALFAPRDSIGRVRPGQHAVLRIDGFPWTQYGTIDAVVEQVGREPRDGVVRVELAVSRANPEIPLEHGLTGSCEVEVERTSPWSLVVRGVGGLVRGEPRAPDA